MTTTTKVWIGITVVCAVALAYMLATLPSGKSPTEEIEDMVADHMPGQRESGEQVARGIKLTRGEVTREDVESVRSQLTGLPEGRLTPALYTLRKKGQQ